MWSGPRALSTALMRAWENRPDCAVIDEPLYGAYLAETGIDHPMREEIIHAMQCDPVLVAQNLVSRTGADIVYQKHMAHHLLPAMGRDWIGALTNAFLIRDPARVLVSYDRKRPAPELADIGIEQQWSIFEAEAERTGSTPAVIDADDLTADPEGILNALCARLGVPFEQAMLAWPEGPRASDGVWAPHWYDSVWRSTGFARGMTENRQPPSELERLIAQARPIYEKLAAYRIQAAG